MTQKSGSSIPRRRRVPYKLITTIGLSAVLFRYLNIRDITKLAQAGSIGPFFLGVLLSGIFVVLRVEKWILLTEANGLTASRSAVYRSVLTSLSLGLFTPARVGEAYCLVSYPSQQRTRGAVLYFIDRLTELSSVLLLSIPGFILLPGWLGMLLGPGAALACLLVISLFIPGRMREGVIGVLSALTRPLKSRRDGDQRSLRQNGLRERESVNTLAEKLRTKIGAVVGKTLAKLRSAIALEVRIKRSYWLLTFVAYVFAYALIVAFIASLQQFESLRFVVFLPVVTLSNLVSITIGGLGVREGLAAALLPLGGIHSEVAASAFFLSFAFTRVIAGVVGLIWTLLTPGGFSATRFNLDTRMEETNESSARATG